MKKENKMKKENNYGFSIEVSNMINRSRNRGTTIMITTEEKNKDDNSPVISATWKYCGWICCDYGDEILLKTDKSHDEICMFINKHDIVSVELLELV